MVLAHTPSHIFDGFPTPSHVFDGVESPTPAHIFNGVSAFFLSITYIPATDAAAYRDQLAENISAASRGSDDEEMWQDIRVVEVYREQGKSLGISILGG